MATKSKTPIDMSLDTETQTKLADFCRAHGASAPKVVNTAVKEWLADYDRGRWPHSHSFVEPNPEIAG